MINKTVITFGSFDVLHIGHVRLLQRARELGCRLIVGVSSDDLNFSKKQRYPVYSENERMEIISAISYVEKVFLEQSLALKASYIKQYSADVLVMGSDWEGKFDEFNSLCEVVYLPRTENVSTTDIIAEIRKYD